MLQLLAMTFWSLLLIVSSGRTGLLFFRNRGIPKPKNFSPPLLRSSSIQLVARKRRNVKMPTLRLGDIVPDFTADTTEGEIRFHDWLDGSWAIFFRWLPHSCFQLVTSGREKYESFEWRKLDLWWQGVFTMASGLLTWVLSRNVSWSLSDQYCRYRWSL